MPNPNIIVSRKDHPQIQEKYKALGEEGGLLGKPRSDEVLCPDGIGRFRLYENGSIYWSPKTGAHEIHGDIRELWASMGWETCFLGYPTTDETVTPDGVGRFNHFEHGSIYWTAETGAHEVHGDIRDKWAESEWERGPLGYPLTSEFRTFDLAAPDVANDGNRLRISAFQNGFIVFSEDDRSTRVVAPATPYKGVTLLVTPIFWGTEWDPRNPGYPGQGWPDVDAALDRVLAAGVADGLQQYGIAHVVKTRATWMDKALPEYFKNVNGGFTPDQLQEGLIDAVRNYGAPEPMHSYSEFDDIARLTLLMTTYVFFLRNDTQLKGETWAGSHINFGGRASGVGNLSSVFFQPEGPLDAGDGFKVCWARQKSDGLSDTLQTAFHEIVEAADDAADTEIGDQCDPGDPANQYNKHKGFSATVAGIELGSYWSNFHKRCVLPPARDPYTNQAAVQ